MEQVGGGLWGASQGGRQDRTVSLASSSRPDCQGPQGEKESLCPGSGGGHETVAQSSPRGGEGALRDGPQHLSLFAKCRRSHVLSLWFRQSGVRLMGRRVGGEDISLPARPFPNAQDQDKAIGVWRPGARAFPSFLPPEQVSTRHTSQLLSPEPGPSPRGTPSISPVGRSLVQVCLPPGPGLSVSSAFPGQGLWHAF